MNDLAQFQPAFNGVNTLLAVSTNIETEQITNGNLKLKGNGSFLKLSVSLKYFDHETNHANRKSSRMIQVLSFENFEFSAQ
jgi:hypothetical protein